MYDWSMLKNYRLWLAIFARLKEDKVSENCTKK